MVQSLIVIKRCMLKKCIIWYFIDVKLSILLTGKTNYSVALAKKYGAAMLTIDSIVLDAISGNSQVYFFNVVLIIRVLQNVVVRFHQL